MQLTTRRMFMGLVAAAAVLRPQRARADKSITLKTLLLADITGLTIDRRAAVTVVTATYSVKDSTGTIAKPNSVSVVLSGAQQTTLESFVTSVILPAANTQEGL